MNTRILALKALTDKELLLYVLQNKYRSDDKYFKFNLTPGPEEDWSRIYEARGDGIPIASVGDTFDKIVLHPGHIYEELFDYYWGNGTWSDKCCHSLDDFHPDFMETISNIKALMVYIGIILSGMGYRVEAKHPGGYENGYLNFNDCPFSCEKSDNHGDELFDRLYNYFMNYDSHKWYSDDLVLFVFGVNQDSLGELIEKIENNSQ